MVLVVKVSQCGKVVWCGRGREPLEFLKRICRTGLSSAARGAGLPASQSGFARNQRKFTCSREFSLEPACHDSER